MKKDIVLDFKELNYLTLGGMISVPVITTGFLLGPKYNFTIICTSIFIANSLSTILCTCILHLSNKMGKSPLEFLTTFFGHKITRIFSVIFFMSACFWFSHQLYNAVKVINIPSYLINPVLLTLLIGSSMTLFLKEGLSKIVLISRYTVPISVLFLCFLGYEELKNLDIFTLETSSSFATSFSLQAITLIFCSSLLGVIELPNYYRFGKNEKISYLSLFVCWVGGLSMVQILGVLLSLSSVDASLFHKIDLVAASDRKIVVLIFILLSTCCANNLNLYAGVLSLKNIFPREKETSLIVFTGLSATIITCFMDLQGFDQIVMLKNIIIGVIIVIIVFKMKWLKEHCYHFSKPKMMFNISISLCSITWGLIACYYECQITTLPILDALLLTAILCSLESVIFTIYRLYTKYIGYRLRAKQMKIKDNVSEIEKSVTL